MRGSSSTAAAVAATAKSLCSAVHSSARISFSALPPARLLCAQSTRPRATLASPSSSRRSHTASIRPSAPAFQPSSPSEQQPSSSTPADDNLTLKFRASSNGEWYTITDAQIGESLKDVAKRHELPSIEATCGGQCECATCHAYVVTGAASASGGENSTAELDTEPPEAVFPEKSEAEDDMLDYAIDRRPSSRLTCQVKVTREMAEWMQQTGGWIELPRF